jgi:hypothetical protein
MGKKLNEMQDEVEPSFKETRVQSITGDPFSPGISGEPHLTFTQCESCSNIKKKREIF